MKAVGVEAMKKTAVSYGKDNPKNAWNFRWTDVAVRVPDVTPLKAAAQAEAVDITVEELSGYVTSGRKLDLPANIPPAKKAKAEAACPSKLEAGTFDPTEPLACEEDEPDSSGSSSSSSSESSSEGSSEGDRHEAALALESQAAQETLLATGKAHTSYIHLVHPDDVKESDQVHCRCGKNLSRQWATIEKAAHFPHLERRPCGGCQAHWTPGLFSFFRA